MGTMLNQVKGQIPTPLIVPASIILMCEILDFISQSGKVQITPGLVAQCTQDTSAAVLQMLKISQQQMHEVVAHGVSKARQNANGAPPQATPQSPQPPAGGLINSAMQGAKP